MMSVTWSWWAMFLIVGEAILFWWRLLKIT